MAKMEPSSVKTYSIRALGSPNPTTLAHANERPIRVEVDNVGPILIFISFELRGVATNPPGSTTYRLRPNQNRVFIMAPKQSMYAVCAGAGGVASVSRSEALPVDVY